MNRQVKKVLLCLLLLLIIQPQAGVLAASDPEHLVLISNESTSVSGAEPVGNLQDRRVFDVKKLSGKNKSKLLKSQKKTVQKSNSVGQVKKFWVYNLNSGTSKQIAATLVYQGSRSLVWVKGSSFSSADATAIGREFDTKIYPLDVSLFGDPSDVDGNGKINLLYYPIDDGAGADGGIASGYFDPNDLTGDKQANHSETLYVDTSQTENFGQNDELSGMSATLAHEFQHLINFNQNVLVEKHSPMSTWLNEGLSMAAEQTYSGKLLQDRIDYYNSDSGIGRGLSLLKWSDSGDDLGNYSLAYLFVQYLRIQCGQGTAIYKDLIQDKYSSYRAVRDVIQRYISPSMSFGDFMTDFRLALYLNEPTGLYGFHDEPGFDQIQKHIYKGSLTSLSLTGGGAVITSEGTGVPVNKGPDVTYTDLSDSASDRQPPAEPSASPLTDHQTVLSGTAEPSSTVILTNGSQSLGRVQADANGSFSLQLTKQTGGSKLYLFVEDRAGNAGISRVVTVLDRTPPVRPSVYRVRHAQRYVSGRAEAGSKMTTYLDSHRIGTAKTNRYGSFRVRLTRLPKKGSRLKIYATDKSGNRSTARTVRVTR
ncbi:MAG: Ig-like domain-containing protein [Sporolactobacillus sp.]